MRRATRVRGWISSLAVLAALLPGGPPGLTRDVLAASAPAAAEPAAILQEIYTRAVKGGPDWYDPAERRKYASPSLSALWAKADARTAPDGEVGAIDFDLTADTNGLTLESFAITVDRQSAEAATLSVKLDYQKPYVRSDPAVVTYDFVRWNKRWLIDNVRTRSWSVRDMLTRWLRSEP